MEIGLIFKHTRNLIHMNSRYVVLQTFFRLIHHLSDVQVFSVDLRRALFIIRIVTQTLFGNNGLQKFETIQIGVDLFVISISFTPKHISVF